MSFSGQTRRFHEIYFLLFLLDTENHKWDFTLTSTLAGLNESRKTYSHVNFMLNSLYCRGGLFETGAI